MISSHKYAFGTLTAAVALAVIAVAFNFFNINATPQAQAQDAIKRSIKFAERLTPEQRAQVEEKIQADLKATLEEAYNAPDLKILSPEEFNAEFNADAALNPKLDQALSVRFEHLKAAGEDPKADFFPAKLFSMKAFKPGNDDVTKYLRYTDSEGRAVTLGVDNNDNVLFKAIKFTEADIQKHMEEGKFKMIDHSNAGEFGFSVGTPAAGAIEWESEGGDHLSFPAGERVFFNERVE